MHPRLARTLGVLILALLAWFIGLGVASTGDDETTVMTETPWWSSVAMVVAMAGALTTLGSIVLIAVGLIRGTYRTPLED